MKANDARQSTEIGDSPLAWLRRRKDANGNNLISDQQFDAGERLREDFYKGLMSASVTLDWSAAGTGGSRRRLYRDKELDLQGAAISARERVRAALKNVGPELSGILVDVCCHSKGIAKAEHAAGLPQHSGKIVLAIALTALARHYGLIGHAARADKRRSGETRHWGDDDYRPSLFGADDPAA